MQDARQTLLDAELLILRAMCQGTPEGSVWQDGLRILADYRFQETVHQLVFDTLRQISADEPRYLRELLPARLTMKGFPDLDLEVFFRPHNLHAGMVVVMMYSLKRLARRSTTAGSS